MFGLLTRAVVASILICVVISGVSLGYTIYRFVLDGYGSARVNVLKQVGEANKLNRETMEQIISLLDRELSPFLLSDDDVGIRQSVTEMQESLDRFHQSYSIDVVLRDRRTFSGVEESEARLQNLLNSYWYIKQLSGEDEISWNLSCIAPDDITSYALSCSQPVRGEDGQVVGIIVLNSTQQSLFQTYQRLLEGDSRVYILDESGIIISHSNQNMIGQWFRSMSAFSKDPGYDSYEVRMQGNRRYILSNYHDPTSGWTFVEEHDITTVYSDVFRTMMRSLAVVLMGGAAACCIGYLFMRRVSEALRNMTKEVSRLNPENLGNINPNDTYYEIRVLTSVFNRLIDRIQEQIRDIQLREMEKRRTEYDFQQAQLDPHFIHNTLVAIKSLIYMGSYEQAQQMLEQFEELLHIPDSADIQFVSIDDELQLIRTYISIMNCRIDKSVEFVDQVPDELRSILIPRMLLQPIVGNSLFHGFAEREDNCIITARAWKEREILLYVQLTDNGEGILPERLAELSGNDYESEGHHHGIGIKNIRKRLQYIYGGQSSVLIESVYGQGTSVLLIIDHYNELPPTSANLRDQEPCLRGEK